MSDKDLCTPSGIKVPWLEKNVDNYLDKTTFIFGGTGSGKTVIIDEIMNLCRDYIPNTLIITPPTSRKSYVNRIHNMCIKEDLTKKKMQQIWQRQVYATEVYNIANNPDTLKSLFAKSPDRESIGYVTEICRRAEARIEEIRRSDASFDQRQGQISNLMALRNQRILAIYKTTIRKYKDYLEHQQLSLEEKTALKFLDFNPRFMLVIDDCSEMMKRWMNYFKKDEENIFEKILYKGRHNFITMVFSCHDDKLIATELRKNARVVFYTNSQSLNASLNKQGNGFSTRERKEFMDVGDFLFRDEKSEVKLHRKFCYVREDSNPLKYTIANRYSDFNMTSGPLGELVNKMPKQSDALVNNPFVQEFVPVKTKRDPKPRTSLPKRKPKLLYE